MNSFVLLNSRNLLTNQAEKSLLQNENDTKMKSLQRKEYLHKLSANNLSLNESS